VSKRVIAFLSLTTALLSVAATRHRPSVPPATPAPLPLVASRSFAVTDIVMLADAFPFRRVLDWMVAGSATPSDQLLHQMFDTQNPRPGLVAAGAPHCDDFMIDGRPAFNGLPRLPVSGNGAATR